MDTKVRLLLALLGSFEVTLDGEQQEWELAMSPDSLTGLLSWLEAAPPGLSRRL